MEEEKQDEQQPIVINIQVDDSHVGVDSTTIGE